MAAAYAYDPLGRRTRKSGTGVTAATYVSSGTEGEAERAIARQRSRPPNAEYNSSGALVTRYVPGPATDQPIAQVTAGGTTTYFHTNKQGSVIAMSGTGAAKSEGPYTYDAYGNCFLGATANACTSAGEPYRFTGRRFDPETGLYYYRARYYSAALGRFLQTDPVGYAADLNLYTYVGNDPTDMTDATGDCPWCVAMAVGAGSGVIIDVGIQLYENGGDFHNINGTEVLESAALGGGLSLLGPTGGLLGRTGARAADFGFAEKATWFSVNNNKILRFGWGWSEEKGANVLRAAGKWIKDLTGKAHVDVPGIAVKGGANATRDGVVSGTAGAIGAHEAQPSSNSNGNRNQAGGSGRSPLFGQTVRAQGTRICPKDSSGQAPNSC